MALFLFTRGILAGRPIPVFNQGDMVRDFTYVDDIVQGIFRVSIILRSRILDGAVTVLGKSDECLSTHKRSVRSLGGCPVANAR